MEEFNQELLIKDIVNGKGKPFFSYIYNQEVNFYFKYRNVC